MRKIIERLRALFTRTVVVAAPRTNTLRGLSHEQIAARQAERERGALAYIGQHIHREGKLRFIDVANALGLDRAEFAKVRSRPTFKRALSRMGVATTGGAKRRNTFVLVRA